MSGRVLFTEKEYNLILDTIKEFDMFFSDKEWFSYRTLFKLYKYVERNTIGKSTCPHCDRIYVATNENGTGWCIKCDWRNGYEK